MTHIPVLYEDEHYVAVHKPHGLLVHRNPRDRRDKVFLVQLLRNQIGRRVYPVHRLDRATSGVMLFACHPEAARHMARHLATKQVTKHYAAVVRGFTPKTGAIDIPLTREVYQKSENDRAVAALTHYERLATIELPFAVRPFPTARYSLLRVTPVTGRTQQIRRHLRHLSHPIIGDKKRGDTHHNRLFRTRFNAPRMLLAATELHWRHPFSGEKMHTTAALSGAFRHIVLRFGWEDAVPASWIAPNSESDSESDSGSDLESAGEAVD